MPNRVKPEGLEGDSSKKTHHPLRFMGLPPGLWRVVQDYCQQSSLHGLKYISNTDLPYIERYLWLGIFLACVGFAIHLIYEVWEFWREKPFLITFDSHMTPIWAVPFPSVTVCSYFSIKRSVVDLATTDNKTVLYYASLVCPLEDMLRTRVMELEYVDNEFYDFIRQASPSCNEVLKRCFFLNKEINCCDLFDPVMTDSGLCFIFNNLPFDRIYKNTTYVPFPSRKHPPHARFWNPEDGYPRPDLRGQNDTYTFPFWEQMAGETFGLRLELFQNITEWQQECSGGYSGFKIILSNPADLPIKSKSMRVSMNRETNLMLNPAILQSRFDMASINPKVRSCVFNNERSLYFFSQYTDKNCNHECISHEYINECGCVPFYQPRGPHIRICSRRKDITCIQKARTKLTHAAMSRAVQGHTHPCDCLKGCQQLSYKSADFYTDFLYTGKDPPWAGDKKLGGNQVTRVTIYFRSNQFLGKHRTIRYTNIKFAGTCGGLLSLLLGFSVISAIEVVYAFLLRPLSRALHAYCIKSKTNVIVVEPVKTQPQPSVFSLTGMYGNRKK